MKDNLIKVTDSTGRKVLIDTSKIKKVDMCTRRSIVLFIRKRTDYQVKVRHRNYRGLEFLTLLKFDERYKSLLVYNRLKPYEM